MTPATAHVEERENEFVITFTHTQEMVISRPLSSDELPDDDGVPLESNWHRVQMNLLIDLIDGYWQERDDFYAGGNMFIYYGSEAQKPRGVRGPDFFVATGVERTKTRRSWVVWEEGGKYPDVIVELISQSTRKEDEGEKKRIYQNLFRTPEYILYYPEEQKLVGWHLGNGEYEPMSLDARGWLWSNALHLWLGTWQGQAGHNEYNTWVRFYDAAGNLVPTEHERRAEAEARAKAIEARATAVDARAKEVEARAAEMERQNAALRADMARLQAEVERLKRGE